MKNIMKYCHGQGLKRLFQSRGLASYFLNARGMRAYRSFWSDFVCAFVLGSTESEGDRRNTVSVRLSPGYKKRVDIGVWNHGDRMTVNEVFCWRCYEYEARCDDVILDLGGNIGVSACYFLSRMDKSCCLVFEPNSGIRDNLDFNLRQFDRRRYEVVTAGIGRSCGKGGLKIKGHSRYTSIVARLEEKGESEVTIYSLHEAINMCVQRFGGCDVVKIDIEGLGYECLDGMDVDAVAVPRVIMIEEDYGKDLELTWLRKNYREVKTLTGIMRYERIT